MAPALNSARTLNPQHFPALLPQPTHGQATASADPRANRLLGALSEDAYQRWLPRLEAVYMPQGLVLRETGRPLKYAYFPITSIVAPTGGLEGGHGGAMSLVGNEGIVGVSMLMDGSPAPGRTVVLGGGRGLRLCATSLMLDFEQGGPVTRLLLLYTQALKSQLAQNLVCKQQHALDRRLGSLLLQTLDRLGGSRDFMMPQELMADALGVRRDSVTEAVLTLQRAGLVRCERGRISVMDRAGLEGRSCECDALVKKEYQRLLPARSVW